MQWNFDLRKHYYSKNSEYEISVLFNEKIFKIRKRKSKTAKFMYSFELSYVSLRKISVKTSFALSSFFSSTKLNSHHLWVHLHDSKGKVPLFVTNLSLFFIDYIISPLFFSIYVMSLANIFLRLGMINTLYTTGLRESSELRHLLGRNCPLI